MDENVERHEAKNQTPCPLNGKPPCSVVNFKQIFMSAKES
jgi:hypothetical protein